MPNTPTPPPLPRSAVAPIPDAITLRQLLEIVGLLAPGNINLYNRPEIPNRGGLSTVYSMSFGDNGREILVPMAADGRILTPDEAQERFYQTGEHLGMFDTPVHADAYAKRLHEDYAAGKYHRKKR